MRKLLLTAALLSVTVGAMSQTGSLVREDRIWNYMTIRYANWDGEPIDTVPDYGYHFEGSKEKAGKTYMSFRNGSGEEVALMRQEGAKVYIYATDPYGELGDADQGDTLLYDLDAQPGVTYPVYFGYGNGCGDIELIEAYRMEVGQTAYDCERIGLEGSLLCPMLIVDGVGPEFGTLSEPFMMWTTGYDNPPRLYTMTDREGNVMFEDKDFRTGYTSVIPENRAWEYVHSSVDGETVSMEMFSLHMERGWLWPSMELYTWSYTIDPLTGILAYNGDKTLTADSRQLLDDYKYSFRGYYGRLYVVLPKGMNDGNERVALVCDYNAGKGDSFRAYTLEQQFCAPPCNGLFAEASVVETGTTNLAEQKVRALTISDAGRELLWVEGLGNTATGLIPYADILDEEGAHYTGYRLNKVTDCWNEEIYRSALYIDIDNLGNLNSIQAVSGGTIEPLNYKGDMVSAPGLHITVYDMAGCEVVTGTGNVSTAGLQPGIYVACAGVKTLKILVK